MGDKKGKYKPYKSAFLNSIYATGEIGRALSQKNRKGIASLNDRQKKILECENLGIEVRRVNSIHGYSKE